MNHDTPGAIPSDDLPFLGPAISPRRPVSGSPLGDADELAAPFVGGAYDPLAAGATGPASSEAEPAAEVPIEGPVGDAPWHAASAGETPWAAEGAAESEGTVEAREDEVAAAAGGLDSFPESDWPSDDFPWLSPSAPEPDEDGQAEAWRPGVDTGELSAPAQSYSVEEEASVQHLSWIGEPASQGEIDAAEAAAASAEVAPAEAAPADAVSEGQEGVIEVSLFAVEGVEEERTGFQVDAESVEGSWTGSESWAEEHAERGGEAWGGEATVEEAAPPEAEAAAGGDPTAWADAETSAQDRPWDEGVAASSAEASEAAVAGDEVAAPDLGLEGEEEGMLFGEVETEETPREAVEAAALPLSEWESGAAAGGVEEEEALEATTLESEPVARSAANDSVDPMVEVAERLERIAGALRSGRPLEAAEQGDPLQLLITGYALGYAQARRSPR